LFNQSVKQLALRADVRAGVSLLIMLIKEINGKEKENIALNIQQYNNFLMEIVGIAYPLLKALGISARR